MLFLLYLGEGGKSCYTVKGLIMLVELTMYNYSIDMHKIGSRLYFKIKKINKNK